MPEVSSGRQAMASSPTGLATHSRSAGSKPAHEGRLSASSAAKAVARANGGGGRP
jgi:hypothetical protein